MSVKQIDETVAYEIRKIFSPSFFTGSYGFGYPSPNDIDIVVVKYREFAIKLLNEVAFARNAVDLADQQPRFCVLYSDKSVESVYVGKTDVFDLTRSIDDKDHAGNKDEFSEALAGGFTHGDTFEGALERTVKSGKCGDLELTETQLNILRDVGNNLE